MKNSPQDWSRNWRNSVDSEVVAEGSATYPLDGRETVYPPYEIEHSTATCGDYQDAYLKIETGGLVGDWKAYLWQRTPDPHAALMAPRDWRLDSHGILVSPEQIAEHGSN